MNRVLYFSISQKAALKVLARAEFSSEASTGDKPASKHTWSLARFSSTQELLIVPHHMSLSNIVTSFIKALKGRLS